MGAPQQVRIQSDGSPRDTVITLPDGTQLQKVRAVSIRMDSGEPLVEADIEIWMPTVDIHAFPQTVTFTCPICNSDEAHRCGGDTLGGRP